MARYNQRVIDALTIKDQKDSSVSPINKSSSYQDIVLLIIELSLKLSTRNPGTTKRFIDIIRKLT